MKSSTYALLVILVCSITTILIRFSPFIVFKNKTPKIIKYLGDVLPYAIMAMLVIYCIKDISFLGTNHGIPEILGILVTALIHKWKKNILLSIVLGTFCYMIFLNFIF